MFRKRRRGPREATVRLALACVGAATVTAALLLAMLALIRKDASVSVEADARNPTLLFYRRATTPEATSERRRDEIRSAAVTAKAPPSSAPTLGADLAVAPPSAPAIDAEPIAPRSIVVPAGPPALPSVRRAEPSVPADWDAIASEVVRGADARDRAERPSHFSGRPQEGPVIPLQAPPARRRRGDIPESYTNAYGEVEIQVTPYCTARQQRPIEVLDSIDTLPAIIHCKPEPSTFELPEEILRRAKRSRTTP
ncbi:MAG: hypothetical protein AAF184_09200 [Pseudomonadota bacterium]